MQLLLGDSLPCAETLLVVCRHMLRADDLPLNDVHHFHRSEENGWFKCPSLFQMNVTDCGIAVGCYDRKMGARIVAALNPRALPLAEENRETIRRILGETMAVRHALHDYRACVDAASFREIEPPEGCGVERLAPEAIRDAWAKEWRTYGARIDGEVVADGSVLDHEGVPISEIRRVATLAAYRNRGLGKAVVSSCVRDILSRGRIPIYRAGVTNDPSLRVAAALGFHRYCESFEALGFLKDGD